MTHWGTVIEVSSTIGAGVFVRQATGHETPEKFFPGFLICFLLLFMSTGSSNGSTFRQMSGSKFCEPCYIDDRLQLHSEPIPDTPEFFVSIRLRVWLAGWRKRSMLFEPEKAGPVLGWTSAVTADRAAGNPLSKLQAFLRSI